MSLSMDSLSTQTNSLLAHSPPLTAPVAPWGRHASSPDTPAPGPISLLDPYLNLPPPLPLVPGACHLGIIVEAAISFMTRRRAANLVPIHGISPGPRHFGITGRIHVLRTEPDPPWPILVATAPAPLTKCNHWTGRGITREWDWRTLATFFFPWCSRWRSWPPTSTAPAALAPLGAAPQLSVSAGQALSTGLVDAGIQSDLLIFLFQAGSSSAVGILLARSCRRRYGHGGVLAFS